MRLELGMRVNEVERLHTEAGRMEHHLGATGARRDAALVAAGTLAVLASRHRLLSHVFMRWVRAMALRPARLEAWSRRRR